MSSTQTNPRRRPTNSTHTTSSTTSPSPSLFKASTFTTPSLPTAHAHDPVIHIPSLPQRSITCPKSIEDLVASHEQRVAEVIDAFDRSFSGLVSTATAASRILKDLLPSSAAVREFDARAWSLRKTTLEHIANLSGQKQPAATPADDVRHAFDSGIGSSLSESESEHLQYMMSRSRSSINTAVPRLPAPTDAPSSDTKVRSTMQTRSRTASAAAAATQSNPATEPANNHHLRAYATKQIKKHIINPILANPTLKNYHSLVKELPQRISDRAITCLRDIEKTLIFCAPVSIDCSTGRGVLTYVFFLQKSRSDSAKSYLNFCETSIQCIHTTVSHLNELDQKRPSDRPYTNHYFVDLVSQVRQYARVMADSRRKEADGEPLDEMDYTPSVACLGVTIFIEPELTTTCRGEKLQLKTTAGKSLELVRERVDGKTVPLQGRTVNVVCDSSDDTVMADDVQRSMARKRKCDQDKEELHACRECGKEYKRPCDLNKHEKTHSRPWKCTHEDCKYYEQGWPTEKERDRHVNDKHSAAPTLYKCLFAPCPYGSKRESNCKQHMEKAHGWEYVRSKTTKGMKLTATTQSPAPMTPGSAGFSSLLTPPSDVTDSPPSNNGTSTADSPLYSNPHSAMNYTAADNNFLGNLDNFNTAGGNYMAPYDMQGLQDVSFGATLDSFLPQNLADHRDSVSTPGLSYYSEDSFDAPQAGFDESLLTVDSTTTTWNSFGNTFTNYSAPQAYPDFDFLAGNSFAGASVKPVQQGTTILSSMTPGANNEALYSPSNMQHSQLYAHEDEGFSDLNFNGAPTSQTNAKGSSSDFTLFGGEFDLGFANGEASNVGATSRIGMFPQLNDLTSPTLSGCPSLDGETEMDLFTSLGDM